MMKGSEMLGSGIFDFPVYPLLENAAGKGNGKNAKKILVCLADEGGPSIEGFLEKVIASVGIDLAEDAFVLPMNAGQRVSFSSLDQEIGFGTALFFGLRPEEVGLNLNVQKYTPLTYLGKTYLFADPLGVIQNKAELKRPLWEALKLVFGN